MLFKTSNSMGTRSSHSVITTARIKTRLLGLSLRKKLKLAHLPGCAFVPMLQ
jgi:hypothetical protein